MRRKIFLSLFVLFACSASGAGLAVLYIRNTTRTMEQLLTLHRVEEMRQSLVIAIQTAQSDLYTVHTSLGQKLDVITENIFRMERAARTCAGCHHAPSISGRIARTVSLVADYESALSYYITASANRERILRLQREAAVIGGELLRSTEEMSTEARRSLEIMTSQTMQRIDRARLILNVTIALSFLLAAAVAVRLIESVTRPIDKLVKATRAIAGGDLGYTIDLDDRTEFGELASHFNAMSAAVRDSHARLRSEVEERRLAEEALRVSEERYALAARAANDGLWDWDLARGRVYYSVRWKSMLGYTEGEISDLPDEWFRRVLPEDLPRLQAQIAAHVEGNSPHCESEYRIRHADGSHLWVICRGIAVRDDRGRARRIAGSQTDITARKKAEQQLLHDAFHDALTGLPNRALFLDRLAHALDTARRHPGRRCALLFLDLDRFKVVNDSLGHLVGDQLLVGVGRRLAGSVRPGDTVARLGGDEFAILLEDVDGLPGAVSAVERTQAELAASFRVEGRDLFAPASIGVALSAERYERPEQMLRDADLAMYQAKLKGRGGYEVFDVRMHDSLVTRLRLESDLRQAVEHGEGFQLHYQPIVDLVTGEVVSLEALIRWRHPEHGLIHPGAFIPLAEESGMIFALGEWTIRAVCEQARIWEGQPGLRKATLAFNVSARQFRRPDTVDRMVRILDETGIEPSRVAIEVTESTIMEDAEESAGRLGRLRSMGIRIHVDDFGTGYSSLSYLHRFPLDAVKIDGSFVSRLSTPGESEELIRAIVSIAESLGCAVIAEGVEEPEQLAKLRNLRCRLGQGYLFAPPMEPQAVAVWLGRGKAADGHPLART